MTPDEDGNLINDTTRQEWSRHYDTLLWAVIAIFSTAVGALVGASTHPDYARNYWPDVGGVVVTGLGVLYVGHFRHFRSRLHAGITNAELRSFLEHPGTGGPLPHGWDAYVLSFLGVGWVFAVRLATKAGIPWLAFAVGVPLTAFLGSVWRKGKPQA